MHNIKIERCWADTVIDLYELCITCSNDHITAWAMECWTSNEMIDDLANKIERYSKKKYPNLNGRSEILNSTDYLKSPSKCFL